MSDLFDDLKKFIDENNFSLDNALNNFVNKSFIPNKNTNFIYDTEISDLDSINEEDYDNLFLRLNNIENIMKKMEQYLSKN